MNKPASPSISEVLKGYVLKAKIGALPISFLFLSLHIAHPLHVPFLGTKLSMEQGTSSELAQETASSSSAKNIAAESSNSSDESSKAHKCAEKDESEIQKYAMSDQLTPWPPPPRKKSHGRLVMLPQDDSQAESRASSIPDERTHTRRNTFGSPILDQEEPNSLPWGKPSKENPREESAEEAADKSYFVVFDSRSMSAYEAPDYCTSEITGTPSYVHRTNTHVVFTESSYPVLASPVFENVQYHQGTIREYPVGNTTFRRDYVAIGGKTPFSASILITADNAFTLFVNGLEGYCVPLVPDCNVFAIEGHNAGNRINRAGALAAIQVRYSDGFTETIVTDNKWHAHIGTPQGFKQVAFDDSAWPAAFVGAALPNQLCGNGVSIPPITSDPGSPRRGSGQPKIVTLPAGEFADTITMDIVADNEYTLYINGLEVGSGTDFNTAQRYQVNFPPSNVVTIAVAAANTGGSTALLTSGAISRCTCGCGANAFMSIDRTWKDMAGVPAGFIAPGFDDSARPAAVP
ncbi:hypothetical protein BDN70DRAFT_922259 [Pholiota conissans]|uniref:Uncharacterized protein n=1 Tax=Pholiota conissans TaxID=109636 RepID=A0A9P6CZ00_9AGAR|nr:hypothetical protein BDN70DRAFT_922259 [Pholiota conissans]